MLMSKVLLRKTAVTATKMLRLVMLAGMAWGIGLFLADSAFGASPDPSLVPKIEAATFEVVIPKAVDDPLTYEKPLPLDLLPFQERTDKYFSVGTAFALGNNRYVTAGHVLAVAFGNLGGTPALRDAAGHVYVIDKIEKFSLQQDFVMFSIKQPPSDASLAVDTKPALNSVVYAVGNALGTGVIIRDGLYTSDTPEEENGRWKWMRFSAAASPGNSGGPLLDQDGKVIGVVLMKSANENLNYALPIGEVLNAPDNVAVIDKRMSYQLDVLDSDLNSVFKAQFPLPKTYDDFYATYLKLFNANSDQQLKTLLQQQADNLFPHGAGSSHILHDTPLPNLFPELIVRNRSGVWDFVGREANRTPLSGNGYIATGGAGHNLLIHLRRPDDIKASQFYSDPKQMMDLILKTGYWERPVGPERIKVTSIGKPTENTEFTDHWQRVWQVEIWPIPYLNEKLIAFALPVPDGYAIIMRVSPAAYEHDSMIDLKTITDFINVDYGGTLAQWKDFLPNTSLLPTVLRETHVDADYGKRFSYASNRIAFDYPTELQTVAPNNVLTLGMGYYDDHGQLALEAGVIQIHRNANDPDSVYLGRHVAPSAELEDNYQDTWSKLMHRQHPYDGVAYSDGDVMNIDTVVDTHASGTPSEVYTAFYSAQGTHTPEEMRSKLNILTKDLVVKPH